MKIRRIAAAAVMAAAAVAGTAGPALASVPAPVPAIGSTHVPFVVIVNGTADVTRQPLTVHQVVYSGGVAYTVVVRQGVEVVFSPRLSGPDRTVLFST